MTTLDDFGVYREFTQDVTVPAGDVFAGVHEAFAQKNFLSDFLLI